MAHGMDVWTIWGSDGGIRSAVEQDVQSETDGSQGAPLVQDPVQAPLKVYSFGIGGPGLGYNRMSTYLT
jgi:hypothetical protein